MAGKGAPKIACGEEIGKGGFGVVYLGRYGQHAEVAIKVVKGRFSAEALVEANMVKELRHPNIIRYIDIVSTRNETSLIMEFIPGQNLDDYIERTVRCHVYWKTCRDIMWGVTHGMIYLHDKNIVHADLKSLNILLRQNYDPVICDFGLARVAADSQTLLTDGVGGTPRWFAPELCFNPPERHSFASDVWAFGCILLEITSQKAPWIETYSSPHQLIVALSVRKNAQVFQDICQQQRGPPKLRDLLCRCCTWNKKQRPDFTAISKELSAMTEDDLIEVNPIDDQPPGPVNPRPSKIKKKPVAKEANESSEKTLFNSEPIPDKSKKVHGKGKVKSSTADSLPSAESLDQMRETILEVEQKNDNPQDEGKKNLKNQNNAPDRPSLNQDLVFAEIDGRIYYQGCGLGVYYLTANGTKQYANKDVLLSKLKS